MVALPFLSLSTTAASSSTTACFTMARKSLATSTTTTRLLVQLSTTATTPYSSSSSSFPQPAPFSPRRNLGSTTTSLKMMQMNCNDALKKQDEVLSFTELSQKPVTTLQGIGPVHQGQLADLRLHTIADLANYKFFHLARAIATLQSVEEAGGRQVDDNNAAEDGDDDDDHVPYHVLNLNKGLDKAYETWSLTELMDAPVAALQGLTDEAGETWKHLGVKTIGDLAECKYCLWAEALQTAAKFEE